MALKMPHIPRPKIFRPKPKSSKPASQDLEVTVVMMGGRRCGKTSVLASMQKCFEENFNGKTPLVITSANESTLGEIEKKRHELVGYFNQKYRVIPELEPTKHKMEYTFSVGLRGKYSRICIRFIDFPGEWLGKCVDADNMHVDADNINMQMLSDEVKSLFSIYLRGDE